MTKEELRKIKEIYARNHFLGISAEALILEVERLQSEIERLQSEREWRPIETARDDTWCIVGWATGKDVSKGIKRLNVWRSANGTPYFNPPTHWMPLPDSPEGGKE